MAEWAQAKKQQRHRFSGCRCPASHTSAPALICRSGGRQAPLVGTLQRRRRGCQACTAAMEPGGGKRVGHPTRQATGNTGPIQAAVTLKPSSSRWRTVPHPIHLQNAPWHTSSVHSVSASCAASLMESGPERAAAASAATHSLATCDTVGEAASEGKFRQGSRRRPPVSPRTPWKPWMEQGSGAAARARTASSASQLKPGRHVPHT